MIPLKATEPVKKFPFASVALVLAWVAADVLSRVWPGPRAAFLSHVWFVPAEPQPGAAWGMFFHPSVFSLCVSIVFAWCFTPRLFERRGVFAPWLFGVSGYALSLWTYRLWHPDSTAPLIAPEGFLGALLGAYMRRDIWGSVDALVIGPGWIRVLEVPSYVLLFFWLFYLLIGNLLTSPPLSDAPLLYWIPFISFLWGFVLESVWAILRSWTSSSSNSGTSAGSNS